MAPHGDEALSHDGLLAELPEEELAWLRPNFGEIDGDDAVGRAVKTARFAGRGSLGVAKRDRSHPTLTTIHAPRRVSVFHGLAVGGL